MFFHRNCDDSHEAEWKSHDEDGKYEKKRHRLQDNSSHRWRAIQGNTCQQTGKQ